MNSGSQQFLGRQLAEQASSMISLINKMQTLISMQDAIATSTMDKFDLMIQKQIENIKAVGGIYTEKSDDVQKNFPYTGSLYKYVVNVDGTIRLKFKLAGLVTSGGTGKVNIYKEEDYSAKKVYGFVTWTKTTKEVKTVDIYVKPNMVLYIEMPNDSDNLTGLTSFDVCYTKISKPEIFNIY